jgi:hypothetical protein
VRTEAANQRRTLSAIRRPDPDQIRFVRRGHSPPVLAPRLFLMRYNTARYPEAIAALTPSRATLVERKSSFFDGSPLASLCLVSACIFVLKPVYLACLAPSATVAYVIEILVSYASLSPSCALNSLWLKYLSFLVASWLRHHRHRVHRLRDVFIIAVQSVLHFPMQARCLSNVLTLPTLRAKIQ